MQRNTVLSGLEYGLGKTMACFLRMFSPWGILGKIPAVFVLFAGVSNTVSADSIRVNDVEFIYRVPEKYDPESRIVVVFGGRDWPGGKTLKTCRFDALADKHGAFLLSPGFRGPKYREPEVWSGKFLKSAVAELEKKYKLKPQKLLFYGYAEGGECANRFYFWMPERVRAWGAHDCTGYPGKLMRNPFPALITRGDGNRSLLEAEQRFIVGYRSAGGSLLRKNFPGAGRDWGTGSLELARLWLDAVLSEERVQEYGEDETLRVVPVSRKKDIETEYRNPFYNSKIRDLWLR